MLDDIFTIRMNLNVVLFSPEIPQNTGNIGRTVYLSNCKLHLIEPIGFRINEKAVRRAGLDYWKEIDLEVHKSFSDFLDKYGNKRIFLSTTTSEKLYTDFEFEKGDFVIFGKESAGLPEEIRNQFKNTSFRIPMIANTDRSLNLSNAVSVVIYEALRQMNFCDLI